MSPIKPLPKAARLGLTQSNVRGNSMLRGFRLVLATGA